MKAYASSTALTDLDADLVAVGLFEDDTLPDSVSSAAGATDATGRFKACQTVYPGSPERVVIVGLGDRDEFTTERARVAAAVSQRELKRLKGESLAWVLPDSGDGADPAAIATGLVEGVGLAAFSFDRFRTGSDGEEASLELKTVEIAADADIGEAVRVAGIATGAANRARVLQSLPANEATPAFLAERAEEIAITHDRVTVELMDGEKIEAAGMGGLAAVARGGTEGGPRLITIRYDGGGDGETLGLVGKSVTFDSGGISIKPSAGMHEMKMDMSGGAAVLEAMAAIAELGLEINIVAVLPATENMPSGTALKPGDVITQLNGKTVEVTNTDAEGRLILADALTWCAHQGADRLVDLATLTGATLIGLGSTYAALIATDDELAEAVRSAGDRTGELAWRLPLHPEYRELVEGSITDLVNTSAQRKAGTIYAGSFLAEFIEGRPWAHLDIAGTAWDTGRQYWGKGPTGFGTRLLIDLARNQAA